MNLEKWILAAALAFLAGVLLMFGMRTALAGPGYDVQRMYVRESMVVTGRGAFDPCRLGSSQDPFMEKTTARAVNMNIEKPAVPSVGLQPPPVFRKRED